MGVGLAIAGYLEILDSSLIVQRLIRGVVVFGGADNGDVAVHAQHGYQKLY
jgi:hypothetical protein